MYVPPWLHQLQRYWFPRRSLKSRNNTQRTSAQRRVRPCLEHLEDRLAPAADAVQTVAGDLSTHFSESQQTLSLTAKVSDTTNPGTTVNEGTVTFTVVDNSSGTPSPIGSPVQSTTVTNGAASASFNLPANEAAGGKYQIDVSYSDGTNDNFTDGGDTAGTLTVSPATVKVVGNDASATFSTSSQTVKLTANLTDDSFPSDSVKDGTVTFTVKNSSGNPVGSSVQGTVSGGTATANFTLPGNSTPGSYIIAVAYSDASSSGDFSDDGTDTSSKLTVSGGTTTTAASNATANFSANAQNVTLTATVTSSSGTVNEGIVDFTLVDSNGNTIGTSTPGAVTNGSASVSYALPAGTAVGSYTIEASYSDGADNFDPSFDNAHTLTINTANSTTLSLTTITINPNLVNGTAQVTLTAQVSNAGSKVSEGVLSFTLAGVSGQANVVNGTASVQLTVPIQNVAGGFKVALSYTDNATSASFANSNATLSVSTNIWNTLLPANLTFDASNNETMQFTVANQPVFGASYSASNGGLLSDITVGSVSMPMTYTTTGNSTVAAIGGVPWGVILFNMSGQFVGTASVGLSADGTPMWVIFDANGQPVAELPYGG
jgi:trimeric autotransporter adhesin